MLKHRTEYQLSANAHFHLFKLHTLTVNVLYILESLKTTTSYDSTVHPTTNHST